VTEAIAKLGENISVARFARFAVGDESTESDGAGAPAAE
jgi:translation elongation factor EF-Ts